jgi:hypothetical protein
MNPNELVVGLLAMGLRCGEAQRSGPLTVVPLFHDGEAVPYRLFAQACVEGLVAVEEVGAGSVPELAVVNRSADPVLLVEGEMLGGLRQTRTLNTTVLIPAQATLPIPVSCVESGRWGPSRPAAREELHAGPRVRAAKNRGVQEQVREGRGYRSHQGEVWRMVDGDLAIHRVASPTASYAELAHRLADPIGEVVGALHPLAGQRGVLALAGGRPVALDLFDRAETLAVLWPGLVGSYAADALAAPADAGGGSGADTAALVAALARGEASTHAGVGLGEVVFITSAAAVVSALVVGAALVHLAALWSADGPSAGEPPSPGRTRGRSWFGEERGRRHPGLSRRTAGSTPAAVGCRARVAAPRRPRPPRWVTRAPRHPSGLPLRSRASACGASPRGGCTGWFRPGTGPDWRRAVRAVRGSPTMPRAAAAASTP